LRKAGAVYMQVLMLTPAVGSRSYVDAYTSGQVYQSAGGADVEPYIVDGNYVVASRNPNPWRKQLNLLAAYLYFCNPIRFFIALLRSKTDVLITGAGTPAGGAPKQTRHHWRKLRRRILHRIGRHLADAGFQILGMFGLLVTSRRTLPWALRLMRGRIKRTTKAPAGQIPMRSAGGGPASHALPDALTLQSESLGSKEKAPVA
ncbi:MAG: radical SAM protein, partial [Phycisphaerae bacterium]|nr:radical SAM protein [Phycisphaerae bacterium]